MAIHTQEELALRLRAEALLERVTVLERAIEKAWMMAEGEGPSNLHKRMRCISGILRRALDG